MMTTPDPQLLEIWGTSYLNRWESNRVFQDRFPEARYTSPVLINECKIANALTEGGKVLTNRLIDCFPPFLGSE